MGIDLAFVNLLTPFPETPLRTQLAGAGRLCGSGWDQHNGAAVTFVPQWMSVDELEQAYWDVHHQLYATGQTARRILRSARNVNAPGFALNAYVNALFWIQNLLRPDHPWPDGASQAKRC